jgi:hypothetical protein
MTPSRSRVRIDRIDLDLVYYTLHMSRERQAEMWLATTNFPMAASHAFYTRLNQRLAERYFDNFANVSLNRGGMVRDILVMEIPNVLRTELYAVAALIGAAEMVLGKMLHLPTSGAATIGAVLCFGLRFIAMRRGCQLPIARPPQKLG